MMTPRRVATTDVRDHPETTSRRVRHFRVAVVSPFLDKSHGTERCVVEQIERLARDHACEIVVYCNNVRDIALAGEEQGSREGRITWRKVPNVPGPQLIRFSWWILANHFVRWRDRRSGEFTPDLLYSPGINCLDANIISVHIVFAEFRARVRKQLTLLRNPILSWPRLLHRRAYYRLLMALESGIYRKEQIPLAGVSKKVADDLERIYGRKTNVSVIYHGVDARQFSPEARSSLRCRARRELGLPDSANTLMLLGNDWKKKGLWTLLDAMARVRNLSLWAVVVGQDDPAPYREALRANDLQHRVLFLPPRSDVEWYYAAADFYIAPSLEDAFALPPLEAMACGIPVVVSRQAGVSEILTHGADGLVLEDPADSDQLARFIEMLISQPEFCAELGSNAIRTARQYTWETNADQLFEVLLNARPSSLRAF